MILGPIYILDSSSTVIDAITKKYPLSWGKIDVYTYTSHVRYDTYHISFQFNDLTTDPPPMQFLTGIHTGHLTGGNPTTREQNIETAEAYSTNIRFPHIPPEYLSTPEISGHVEVKSMGQRSICPNMNCIFTYMDIGTTPQITSFSYDSGGGVLTLLGVGFGGEVDAEVDIELGGYGCVVGIWTNTEINCTVGGSIVGGAYIPHAVYPKGKWVINTEDSLYIEYSILEVTPSTDLNPQGGQILTITGTNFPLHIHIPNSHLRVYFDGVGELEVIRCDNTEILVSTIPVATAPVIRVVLNEYEKVYSGTFTMATLESDVFPQITQVTPVWGSPLFHKELNITGRYILYIYIYIVTGSMSGFTEDTVKVYLGTETTPKIQELGVLEIDSDTGSTKVRFQGGEIGTYKITAREESTGNFLGNAEFTIKAEITSITPERGSWMGGGTLTLTGHGFSPDIHEEYIYFGDTPCIIQETEETQIICQILPPIYTNIEQEVPAEDVSTIGVVSLRFNTLAACPAPCYTFSDLVTPVVTQYEVREVIYIGDIYVLRLVIEGEKFDLAGGVGDVRVNIDGYLQVVEDWDSAGVVVKVVRTRGVHVGVLEVVIDPYGRAYIPLVDGGDVVLPRGLLTFPLQIGSVQGGVISAEFGSYIYIQGIYIIYIYIIRLWIWRQ